MAVHELKEKDAAQWKKPDKHGRDTFADDMERCTHMIRGKRQCQHRRSDGLTTCQLHEPSRLAKERELSVLKKRPRPSAGGGAGGGDDNDDGGGDGDDGDGDGDNDDDDGDGDGGPEKKRLSAIKRVSGSQSRMYNGLSPPPDDPGVRGLPAGDASWATFFTEPNLPVHVDIGCARGKLVADLAERHRGTRNYIGIEAREKLVEEAGAFPNCRFLCGNLMSDKHRAQLEASFAAGSLHVDRVSILFPDPWVKPKHKNRRIVQVPVLQGIAKMLRPGGLLIIASDVEDMMTDARTKLEQCGDVFEPVAQDHPLVQESLAEGAATSNCGVDDRGYVKFNPFRPLASERELVCEMAWRRVYRFIWVRK
jgi:tRNA (guanine-N7-)-methyltransferase